MRNAEDRVENDRNADLHSELRIPHSALGIWWAFPVGLVLVVIILGMFIGKPPQHPAEHGTYDAAPDGIRAAYLLLEKLDYPVKQSKRLADGKLRWILFPQHEQKEIGILKQWVEAGGILLVGDPEGDFLEDLGLAVEHDRDLSNDSMALILGDKKYSMQTGSVEVSAMTPAERSWPEDVKNPLVSIHRQGRGEIWLLHYPEFVKNELLLQGVDGKNDNAQVLCRLADAMLEEQSNPTLPPGGGGQGGGIYIDEYFHGMRERPTVTELLLQPPVLWSTLHGLALLGLALWAFSPRFGQLQELTSPRRRSKEEYLDAIASILQRKGAYQTAYRTARTAFIRDLARDLGLPAEAPVDVMVKQVELRRPGVDAARLQQALTREETRTPASSATFVESLQELDDLRHACFTVGRISK